MNETFYRTSTDEERVFYNYSNQYPLYLERDYLSTYPNFSAESHWHDEVELLICHSGQMDYNINGTILSLTPGTGVFVNSRQLHYGFSNEHQECYFTCIIFSPKILASSSLLENTYITPLLQHPGYPYLFFQEDTSWGQELFSSILEIAQLHGSPHAILKTQKLLYQIWIALFEQLPDSNTANVSIDNHLPEVKAMMELIHTHYQEDLTLDQIAAAGHVCKSKCCKLFRHYLYRAPIAYLTLYRLQKSAILLQTTDLSITEIAYAVGFHGASYYAETFRKWMGCNPREFRLTNKQIQISC